MIKIGILVVMIIMVGTSSQVFGQEDYEYQARLKYCYDLYTDISDDFGWFWHELCHLRINEHSHHYWDMLHKYMPNYHDKIEWLKINGSNLL
jgi:hypothetical protein